jgi:hypothetical protein
MKVYFFGRKTIASAIIASVISFLIVSLRGCGITESDIYKWYFELQKLIKWDLPKTNDIIEEVRDQLNRKIIQDPELLDYRVRRDVDDAIHSYERYENENRVISMKNQNILEEINKNKYNDLQKKIVENAVYYEFADGTMGIRGSWVPEDPREIDLEKLDESN